MQDGDALLDRLGNVHQAIHEDGARVLGAVIRTAQQMLEDRGCTAVRAVDDALSEILEGRPVVLSDETLVFVHSEDRVGVKAARAMVEQCDGKLCVCVSIDGPTAFTRNEFQTREVQFMMCRALVVNVTHHSLVPRHRLVDPTQLKVDTRRLPVILDTDPIVQYYNWPVGSVLHVERAFFGSEPVPYYRTVQASS